MSRRKRQQVCQKNCGTNSLRNDKHHFNWRNFKASSISFHKQMTKKEILLEMATCFIVCVSLVGMYLYFIDGSLVNVPLKYDSSILKVEKPVYKSGDQVYAYWKFTKGNNATATINANIIDGVVWYLPEVKGVREKGDYDKLDVVANIPSSIPDGTYHIELNVEYQVNPIKTVKYHFKTNDFLIDNN